MRMTVPKAKAELWLMTMAVAIMAAGAPARAANAGGDWNDSAIAWRTYEDGLSAAKAEKRPICLIFYTEWCPHCKNYSGVFHDPRVVERAKQFVMIRIDKDKNPDPRKHYAVDGQYSQQTSSRRRAGDADSPRILGTFNEPIDDWLSFYMFTTFTDRDGKWQLLALAESGFDPLSRTTRFMPTEEAHHMFVGETGVGRVIKRALEVMEELGTDEPDRIRAHGAIDLPTIQRYLNRWFSSSVDLFGSERSSNAAAYFAAGLKGRHKEAERFQDHGALAGAYEPTGPGAAGPTTEAAPPPSQVPAPSRSFPGGGAVAPKVSAARKSRRCGDLPPAPSGPPGTAMASRRWSRLSRGCQACRSHQRRCPKTRQPGTNRPLGTGSPSKDSCTSPRLITLMKLLS